MVRVARVAPVSIGAELGVVPGTELLTVSGRSVDDFLDWEFLTAEEAFEVEARLPSGESVIFDIERDSGDSLGIELEPPTVRVAVVGVSVVSSRSGGWLRRHAVVLPAP